MTRKISLYIDDTRADLTDDALIIWNYTQEDLDNPTIVQNSYTNSVTLPATPTNNRIFESAFRLDRVSGVGFNPRARTPFAIYDEMGNLLESGYCKLDSVEGDGPLASYSVTLFGGLGSLLYGLAYNAAGDALTLADLDYLQTGTPATEFDYAINALLVSNAWDTLAGGQQNELFETINFAPAYNGIPDDFGADKCVFDGAAYGYSGTLVAHLSKEYTEREMLDYRSYLQRPVLRVAKVLEAIQRKASGLGFTLDLSLWATQGNPFYEDTWMTLPILKDKRSGDTITKADLLGGTCSPAEFLLGIVKTFGLKVVTERNVVTIMPREDFFINSRIDLTSRVDRSTPKQLSPLLMDAKWYEFSAEDEGEFAGHYKEIYGRIYGSQRVDTGYEFDSAVRQLVEDLPFRGAVQSQERSVAFRNVVFWATGKSIPGPFLDGGTFTVHNGDDQTEEQLLTGRFTWSWWNANLDGYDIGDLPQLHGADNKAIDGAGVLLFFDGTFQAAPSGCHLSDDIAAMGEEPCWNCSGTGIRDLMELPHFTRFLLNEDGEIAQSLDWGAARELNIPGASYAVDPCGLYADFWRAYLTDRFNENTKRVTLRVHLDGLQVGVGLLRRFYWYGGSLWVLNKISNYSLTTFDPAECEFVQVRDIDNYTTGQY